MDELAGAGNALHPPVVEGATSETSPCGTGGFLSSQWEELCPKPTRVHRQEAPKLDHLVPSPDFLSLACKCNLRLPVKRRAAGEWDPSLESTALLCLQLHLGPT